MKTLRSIRNYLLYCGIEKDEYNAIKEEAYVSNFVVWRVLHYFMAVVFAAMFIVSLTDDLVAANRLFYLGGFIYSAVVACLFLFVFDSKSVIAQLVIYLSISALFLLAALIAQNRPEDPATTFIVLLLITPMFMIDKPYFMAIVLGIASGIFLVWMHGIKPYDIWRTDAGNVAVYALVGVFLHIVANAIRIREFVLARKIRIQKDTDDLTGLKNKGAVTREINAFLTDGSGKKGIMFLLDIDRFKSVNDTYGHDMGDKVINQFGRLLGDIFTNGETVGRFGGDEFIVFIKDTDETAAAEDAARKIIDGAAQSLSLPDRDKKVGVSIGIAILKGDEKNYSEIFKKADIALYDVKSGKAEKYGFFREAE